MARGSADVGVSAVPIVVRRALATRTTPMAATITWTNSSSQSMPLVAVGMPRARAMKVPMNAATMPTTTVSQTGIGWRPGHDQSTERPDDRPDDDRGDDASDGHSSSRIWRVDCSTRSRGWFPIPPDRIVCIRSVIQFVTDSGTERSYAFHHAVYVIGRDGYDGVRRLLRRCEMVADRAGGPFKVARVARQVEECATQDGQHRGAARPAPPRCRVRRRVGCHAAGPASPRPSSAREVVATARAGRPGTMP